MCHGSSADRRIYTGAQPEFKNPHGCAIGYKRLCGRDKYSFRKIASPIFEPSDDESKTLVLYVVDLPSGCYNNFMSISVVINTRNEETNIERCLASVSPFAHEIVVVDMHSTDNTVEMARRFTDKIWEHDYIGYVEPARNFAMQKATSEWILILDADEVVSATLGNKLTQLAKDDSYAYYRLPRRNLVFGKWLKHSGWWPDYQIRFFRKNSVNWNDEIHSIPVTRGEGMDLPAEEKSALIHYHYESVSQYISRLNRYTTEEARQRIKAGETFVWSKIISEPTSEFVRRFFAWEGYKDGVHGLTLALLQSVSFLVTELKIWEAGRFEMHTSPHFLRETGGEMRRAQKEVNFWYFTKLAESSKGLKTNLYKLLAKIGL